MAYTKNIFFRLTSVFILKNLLLSYFLIAQLEDSEDDQKLVILAGAIGGTVGSIVILLAVFLAVIVIRRRYGIHTSYWNSLC